jgi:hypothetical protein
MGGEPMSRRYPKEMPWKQTTRETYPGCTHCQKCGREFGHREVYWRREIKVSYMRGDDEVEMLCDGCKRGGAAAQEPPR